MKYILPIFIILSFTACKKEKPQYTVVTAKVLKYDFKDPILKPAKLTAYILTDQGKKFLEVRWDCNIGTKRRWRKSSRRIRSAYFLLKIAKRKRKKIRFKVLTSRLNAQTYYVCPDQLHLEE